MTSTSFGLSSTVVSTEDRAFWSICWAGGAHGSGWDTCCKDLWWAELLLKIATGLCCQVWYSRFLSLCFGLFWSNLSSFSAFYILLPIAQRWSRRLFISNHKLGRCSLKNSSWPNTYVAYKHFIFFKFDSDSWFTSVLLVLTKSVYKKGEGGVTQKSFKDQKKKSFVRNRRK